MHECELACPDIGELRVDAGAGVFTLRGLGAVRPIVGSIFGVAAYFALKSGFITLGTDNIYFFTFFSFVAGFSERLLPDLVRRDRKLLAEISTTGRTRHRKNPGQVLSHTLHRARIYSRGVPHAPPSGVRYDASP